MRRLSVTLILVVSAAVGCARPAPAPGPLSCAPIEGLDAALAEEIDTVVIDGDQTAALAAQALACAAAASGSAVLVGAPQDLAAELAVPIGEMATRGGALQVFHFDSATGGATPTGRRPEDIAKAQGDARGAAYAASAGVARGAAAGLLVLVAPAPEAATSPVGLSGHEWRPLGARLPAERTLNLRAEGSASPGMRIRLSPFEDVPLVGAAMKYDGVIQIGPAATNESAS
ncbi:MAG: hypothetical protein GC189_02160 [Alphaproteobacteria bacterium]|nr:hypothetical protein [Alphaproteobacteria bacterium]